MQQRPDFDPDLGQTDRAGRELKLAVIYDDFRAGRLAMDVVEEVNAGSSEEVQFSLVLWRFDRLERMMWRCHATDDFAAADIVIVSLSNPGGMPEKIRQWFAQCLGRKLKFRMTVITLLGEEASVALTCHPSRDPSP